MRVDPKLHKRQNNGSALILVVVVTMLLSVIGIVFIMTARLRGIAASGVTDSRDLDAAVQSVVSRVDTVLVQDLFGKSMKAGLIDGTDPNNEPYDSSAVDTWLASLEPDATMFAWPYITDLSGGTVTLTWNKVSAIVAAYQDKSAVGEGRAADADGDGIADSMWIKLPNLTTGGGKPVYAAVRIIDNCAMLNLNTAFGFYQDTTNTNPWYMKSWYEATAYIPASPYDSSFGVNTGRYLGAINYGPFLRAHDIGHIERLRLARDITQSALLMQDYYNNVIMKIESPGFNYTLFNIGDELEIRNRFLLTSKGISRFEKRHKETENANATAPGQAYSGTMYYTFDLGRGIWGNDSGAGYPKARVPSTPFTASDFQSWKNKINSQFFDFNPPPAIPPTDYEYDRRHLCTFYSFDRNIRTAQTTFYTSLENQPNPIIRNTFLPEYQKAITTNFQNLTAAQPYNNTETRRKILHLLYAFREHFYPKYIAGGDSSSTALVKAARQSAQIVANMIDYSDGNNAATQGPFFNTAYKSQRDPNMTFIDRSIVRQMILEVSGGAVPDIGQTAPVYPNPLSVYEFGLGLSDTTTPPFETVYGYERQPFISEVYTRYVTTSGGGGAVAFAVELLNPYSTAIDLKGWNIKVGTQDNKITSASTYVVPAGTSLSPGRLVLYNIGMAAGTSGTWKSISGFGLGMPMTGSGNVLRLQRSDPANNGQFLTVDKITEAQRIFLMTDGMWDTSRKDTNWAFVNYMAYYSPTTYAGHTLGAVNTAANSNVTLAGYALPVANDNLPIGRLADFEKVAFISNQPDPDAITTQIAAAVGEANVRFDMITESNLLDYICTLNRDAGNLPGRININTAPRHVIAAAIPPMLTVPFTPSDPNNALYLAGQIVINRPYTSLADLLKIPAIKKFANNNPAIVGDTSISGDFEKRDWILSRLSNIFTVRSDTFTAYILVRLGTDGPQRRMLAIFDRSQVWSPIDKPKLVALHPVSDPR